MRRGKWIVYLAGILTLAVLASGCANRQQIEREETHEQTGAKDDALEEAGTDTASAEESGEEKNETDPAEELDESALETDVKEQLTGKTVRVAIQLATPSVTGAGFKMREITTDPEAQAYQARLKEEQQEIARRIEEVTDHPLDVVWSFTLSSNVISANVYESDIQKILSVEGVVSVSKEQLHELHG